MAMNCCHKEYAEVCEILVCVDAPPLHNPNLYHHLRFGLLASWWLPSPLGIFLWSALHVILLIVGGPAFWVLGLLTAFLFHTVFVISLRILLFGSTYVVLGLLSVAVDLGLLFRRSIRFCWSLVGFLAGHEANVEWTGGNWWIVLFWKDTVNADVFWSFVSIEVPCMNGSLYEETKDRKLKTWARWCEEVVHMHDAIAL